MNTYIYSLSCPINNTVRYIGKSNDPKKRYSAHINNTQNKTKKNLWILSLSKKGLTPILEIIDCIPIEDWEFYEKHYIKIFKSLGANLTNGTNGGDGASLGEKLKGIPRTIETKKKISEAKKGFIVKEEVKKKIKEKLIGFVHNDTACKNMGKAQKSVWENYSESDKANRLNKLYKVSQKRNKPVSMVKDGIVLNTFVSARIAANETNLCYKKISAVCKKVRKTHGGYEWQFAKTA